MRRFYRRRWRFVPRPRPFAQFRVGARGPTFCLLRSSEGDMVDISKETSGSKWSQYLEQSVKNIQPETRLEDFCSTAAHEGSPDPLHCDSGFVLRLERMFGGGGMWRLKKPNTSA